MAQELSEVFYTFLITSVIGLMLGIGRICYKSKCSTVDLCCVKIVRNVDAEVKEDLELGNDESKK
jgi:ABC-type amino acid transport system permease subunit